jgi:CheY-like chemotaxis protein
MAKQRLLLIEDDYDVAEMLLMYFTSQGYETLHADNGSDGVMLARSQFPNLILLDIMLPDMDGYDVCLRLRRMALTKFIPILFLTQRDERASKVRGLELGADDYITKPFDVDELRLRVKGTINRATRENLHEPRTGLPTGTLIDDEVQRRRAQGGTFQVMGYRVQGFQPYQDVYGFVAANDVLSYAGTLMQKIVAEHGTEQDFIGIQEDEFWLLTHVEDISVLDQTIKSRFSADVQAFYSYFDVEGGGLVINAGTDQETVVPLMSLVSSPIELTEV